MNKNLSLIDLKSYLLVLQNSSVEGVFPQQRSTHPFRIIENDAMSIQSMTSLGRVGRILAGTVDASSLDKDTQSSNATISNVSNSSISTLVSSAPKENYDSKAQEKHSISNKPDENIQLQGICLTILTFALFEINITM